MRNIFSILIISCFLGSCIDVIKSSDEDFYESVHVQGGGWFEFYQNNQTEILELNDNFTFQVWFSGQETTADDAPCILSLKGTESDLSIYRNPNINNIIMIYYNEELIKELDLDIIDLSDKQNFYLISIVKDENEISIYLNENKIMEDESTPLIIQSDEIIKPIIGATINDNNNPENLWYGYIDEIRYWDIALHDTVINFHNQHPTKVSASYNSDYLTSLNGLWNFKIDMSEASIDNVFQDINDNPLYTIIYTLESMSNELSELGR